MVKTVSFRLDPNIARIALHVSDVAMPLIGPALQMTIPRDPLQVTESGSRALLNLGPDDWLGLFWGESATTVLASLAQACPFSYSAVDITDRQMALELEGPASALILNSACPLDLSLSAFPVGQSTRTVLAKAGIVLWRRSDDHFHLEIGRTHFDYCLDILQQARNDWQLDTDLSGVDQGLARP